MEPLNISIEGLSLDTVLGERYDLDADRNVPLTLADAIVEAAARRLAGGADWPDVKSRVRQIRDDEIRKRVAAEIEAAVTNSVQRTNGYGEPIGEPTTLRQEIARIAGEAVKLNTRASGLSHQSTALQEVIRTEVDKALAAELKSVVDGEKAKVVKAVRDKAAELLAQAVKDGLR